jgi:C-terminal processing protease CtpA/Prc
MLINQLVDPNMFYGAIEGMVAGLGDQNSIYFSPEKAEEFALDLSGEFEVLELRLVCVMDSLL